MAVVKSYTIILRGMGAGTVLCASPALESFVQRNPLTRIYTGYPTLLDAPVLEGKVYPHEALDIHEFETYTKDSTVLVPSPYTTPRYYRGEVHLIGSFNYILNGTYCTPSYVGRSREARGDFLGDLKVPSGSKLIVLQPFGNTATAGKYEDHSHRSLTLEVLESLVYRLSENYTLLYMGVLPLPEYWPIRQVFGSLPIENWRSIISRAHYFIGCDSVGQHMAYREGTPGTVIFGNSLVANVGYSDHFNIIPPKARGYVAPVALDILNSRALYDAFTINNQLMRHSSEEVLHSIERHLENF